MFNDFISYSTSTGERNVRRIKQKFNETTDPQAKILFEKRIDPKYFLKIYPLDIRTRYKPQDYANDDLKELPFW